LVRFGDVVRDVKVTIDRNTTELTRFVAGEHMDSDDIHLRRWGELDGDYLGPAFHRGFRKGQVLYGSRRTYLKKVAVAPFDGICANTTFVLESVDSDILLPELLPFIMLTDSFTQHSIRESKGSVNPYINWKDIAKYEFPLPPKDEQRRIAEIILAADETVIAWQAAACELHKSRQALLSESYPHGIDGKNGELPPRWRTCLLGDIIDLKSGGTPSRQKPEFWNGAIPWVKTGEVEYTDIFTTEESITQAGVDNSSAKVVPAGTILMALFGQGPTLGRVGRLMIDATVNQACAALLPCDEVDQDYLYFYLVREYDNIRHLARGASQPNLNLSIVRHLHLPLCDLQLQQDIGKTLRHIEQVRDQLSKHIFETRRLSSQLVNNILAGGIDVH
jgi:type I restriction enzyme S subunit